MKKFLSLLFAITVAIAVITSSTSAFAQESEEEIKEESAEEYKQHLEKEMVKVRKKTVDVNTAANNAAAYRDEQFVGAQITEIKDGEKQDTYVFTLLYEATGITTQIECSAVKDQKCRTLKINN